MSDLLCAFDIEIASLVVESFNKTITKGKIAYATSLMNLLILEEIEFDIKLYKKYFVQFRAVLKNISVAPIVSVAPVAPVKEITAVVEPKIKEIKPEIIQEIAEVKEIKEVVEEKQTEDTKTEIIKEVENVEETKAPEVAEVAEETKTPEVAEVTKVAEVTEVVEPQPQPQPQPVTRKKRTIPKIVNEAKPVPVITKTEEFPIKTHRDDDEDEVTINTDENIASDAKIDEIMNKSFEKPRVAGAKKAPIWLPKLISDMIEETPTTISPTSPTSPTSPAPTREKMREPLKFRLK